MKRWTLCILAFALILMGGCGVLGTKKDPDTAAFNDNFTKEFMSSPEEEKSGYYKYKSKTEGYSMLYPKNAVMDQTYYKRDDSDSEYINFGESEDNISYVVRLDYGNDRSTEDTDTYIEMLSDSMKYNGEYRKITKGTNIIHYATNKKHISNKKNGVYYDVFGYIHSGGSQGIKFIYSVTCGDENKECNINVHNHKKKALMLMKSIEFN